MHIPALRACVCMCLEVMTLLLFCEYAHCRYYARQDEPNRLYECNTHTHIPPVTMWELPEDFSGDWNRRRRLNVAPTQQTVEHMCISDPCLIEQYDELFKLEVTALTNCTAVLIYTLQCLVIKYLFVH